MTKEVLISVTGMHMMDGDSSDVELVTTGKYYVKNGIRYILYDESIDGLEQPVKNVVKVRDDSMEVIRRGGFQVHMTFKRGMTLMASYATPFGEMSVGITTGSIQVAGEEDSLHVHAEYLLDMNGQQISRCRIALEVRSRAMASQ